MVHDCQITFYNYTGYSPIDEPASDAVINQNSNWTMPFTIKERDPSRLRSIRVKITQEQLLATDYVKVTSINGGGRWYYYVLNNVIYNEGATEIGLALDAFATVGLANIQFAGMIARRSLTEGEADNFPLLPEPFAPRRPLLTRRIIIDTNTNKRVRIPSHITTTFEEVTTHIEHPENPLTIDVPTTPLGLATREDSLSYQADIPFGYPNPAASTEHVINTPWGNISYETPYEQYYELAGAALLTFLEKAKKHDALDLVEQPYYLPSPSTQSVTISELSNAAIRNPKALKHYLTITIRSLAGNVSQTYGIDDIDLQVNQQLVVVVQPDKNGGIYVSPAHLRDTGLNAYTYLNGVYSPFETAMFNAVGDTPAKYAADGTYILNNALNDLFRQYIGKINALQYEGMVANYFKDMASAKGLVMTFASELLGSISTSVATTGKQVQEANITTDYPTVRQTLCRRFPPGQG